MLGKCFVILICLIFDYVEDFKCCPVRGSWKLSFWRKDYHNERKMKMSVTNLRNPVESLRDGQGFRPSGHPGVLSDQATSVDCCVRSRYDSPVRSLRVFCKHCPPKWGRNNTHPTGTV